MKINYKFLNIYDNSYILIFLPIRKCWPIADLKVYKEIIIETQITYIKTSYLELWKQMSSVLLPCLPCLKVLRWIEAKDDTIS